MVPKPFIPQQGPAVTGEIPLAAVTVNGQGVISYWDAGAHRLFGLAEEDACGRPAAGILPVAGVLDSVGDGAAIGAAYAEFAEEPPLAEVSSGRFWGGRSAFAGAMYDLDTGYEPGAAHGSGTDTDTDTAHDPGIPQDVLWWACPLIGPGLLRLLVLATDGARLQRESGGCLVSAGFAPHDTLPDREERRERLSRLLTDLEPLEREDIVGQLLDQGYPVLFTEDGRQIPVLPRLSGGALPPPADRA